MTDALESLRTAVDELERRVDAIMETLKQVIAAFEPRDSTKPSAKSALDFSHIPGHIEHTH